MPLIVFRHHVSLSICTCCNENIRPE